MSLIEHDAGLVADDSRTIVSLFRPGEGASSAQTREADIVDRIMALGTDEVDSLAASLLSSFAPRHTDIERVLADNAAAVEARVDRMRVASRSQRIVIGATFTSEFAVEAAALCNPSAMPHPDQSGLEPGQRRLAVALRCIGEGHVSSIGFASAVIGPGRTWRFEPRQADIVAPLIDDTPWSRDRAPVSRIADSTYRARFDPAIALSRRMLVPVAVEERQGMEDARFVRFTSLDGTTDYRATYTAYDGRSIAPRLLTSPDLADFTVTRLTGNGAHNKGMALFPRPIGGQYLALGRTDGENITLATSSDGLDWRLSGVVHRPDTAWNMVQTGNCGSPLETRHGWIALIHGVGPLRTYSMGAMLLDRDDPSRVLAVTRRPFLTPDGALQNGYVPNVVYSCGGIIDDRTLWIPFGVGDSRVRVASLDVDELVESMTGV